MTNIETFFKDNFDGMEAYVSSGGLHLDGNVEQKCKLNFVEYIGLRCFINLEYNYTKLDLEIQNKLSSLRESLGISYYIRNTIVDELTKIVKTTYVQIGVIGTIDIKSISSNYESKTVRDCEIKYEDGSIVKIRCNKQIK